MSKAYKEIARDAYQTANNYMGKISAGADHTTALYQTTGISGGINRPTAAKDLKGQKKADEQIKNGGPGTLYFDEEENTWTILGSNGQPIKVTVDKIKEAYNSGTISKLRNASAKA